MLIRQVTPIIIKRYLNAETRKRTLFLRGPSGIGKSEVVFQAADLLAQHVPNWKGVIDLRLAQMDPTDLRGVPHVTADNLTSWARPDFLPRDGAGILFLDEITSAPPAVQAAAYQLCLTPWDFGVPREWMVIAAGNNKADRGVTFNIAAPLQNRLCDLHVDTHIDDFIPHAVANGVRPEVLSFLRDRPDMLHKFDGKGEIGPFPSPRSWFAVSSTMELDNIPTSARIELFRGDVGAEAALAFETHLRVWETIPRLDDILEGKDVPVPKDMNVTYCVAMGLATRLDKDNIDKAWNFMSKLKGEVQSLTMKLAFTRDESISTTAAWNKWAQANAAAFRQV